MVDTFTIKNETGEFLKLTLDNVYGFPDKTCHWGGYDARATIEIKSGSYYVKTSLVTSTGNVFLFFQQLKECNTKLKGAAIYNSYEGNLSFTTTYDDRGHVKIKGDFSEDMVSDNELLFSFDSDQSFIKYTLDDLELIAKKYGDLTGIKRN